MQTYTGTEMDEWQKRMELSIRADRAHQLRQAAMAMVVRYSEAEVAATLAARNSEPHAVWLVHFRAANRRFQALQRLTGALRDFAINA